MKKIILTILILATFIVPSLILADNDNTITYLKAQGQNAWISQALAAASVSNIDVSYIDYNTSDLMTASKNILTLAAIKSNDSSGINKLLAVVEASKNNNQFGSQDLLNDDFWALMALASVNKLQDTASIKNFILEHQNSDGGWSWSTIGDSDSNDTAAAMMTLFDLGLNTSSIEIIQALAYLQNTQNDDGGFGYDIASSSDGASTAWVIAALNKFGIDASTWQKNNNTPKSFLESLRQADGSFLWMPSDEQGSSMVTAYSLLALTGRSYPVHYIEFLEDEVALGHTLRVEGPDNTICLASNLEANTVLGLLELGSSVCDFEYIAQDSAYGTYISAIDGIAGEGMNGWQYFVDFESGMVAAGDYILTGQQEVLWAYGGWPFYAVKLEVNNTHFESGDNLLANFMYYDGETWLPLIGADIVFGANTYQTDNLGQFTIVITSDGVFPIFSKQTQSYSRSNRKYIVVGTGLSQTVDLSVNIESGGGNGPGADDIIAFSVDRSNIDFGTLNPGESADTIISLSNTGNVNIYIEASVLGDKAFTDFTFLDQTAWDDYNLNLASSASKAVNVGLSIPSSFDSLGQKEGQLIFWGISK
ncbi:MAG: prenyltransferase/squalene oxidase repeat-containing protein [Patescibacteria group bacterium]|jgi:prenyltransferase beta subunit